ncbi:MAG: cytochrome-c oxidase, cbb3-type subunit III [Pseudomonadota bacterium]
MAKQDPHGGKPVDAVTGTETTGHEWDGIRELNTPMPLWWLYTFYATVVFAAIYCLLYPAVPLVSAATSGLLGYASRAEVEAEIATVDAGNSAATERVASASFDEIRADPELAHFALKGGASVFRTNCSTCHGAGGAGSMGYPNLVDDDWIWGGDMEAIATTVRHGINASDPDSRYAEMPAFGDMEMLDDEQILAVAEQVRAMAGLEHDATLAAAGEGIFLEQCSACHGEAGEGMIDLGAPTLTDAIWLYGGDRASLVQTITHGRGGMMPAWNEILTEAEIKKVAIYVHSFGGGE